MRTALSKTYTNTQRAFISAQSTAIQNSPNNIRKINFVQELMKKCPIDAFPSILRLPSRHVKKHKVSKLLILIQHIQHIRHDNTPAIRSDDIIDMFYNFAMPPLVIVIATNGIGIGRSGGDAYEFIRGRGRCRLGRGVVMSQ